MALKCSERLPFGLNSPRPISAPSLGPTQSQHSTAFVWSVTFLNHKVVFGIISPDDWHSSFLVDGGGWEVGIGI